MISVTIIGSGNVGTHLAKALSMAPDVTLKQLYSRRPDGFSSEFTKAEIIHDLHQLEEADVYLLAVSDDAVKDVSQQLPFSGRLVAHTSGTLPLETIDRKNRRGVWYPLQTFSRAKAIDFQTIPICIETEQPSDAEILTNVARALSQHVYTLKAEQRQALHVAAVFACNFTNHLYAQAARICDDHQLDFDMLKPLIRETADKVMTMAPIDAQTGPAKRHDDVTLAAHRRFLGNGPATELYDILTQSIQREQL
ncbi:Rossmann-like and DUF2520 domain-containing protein [Flavobacterium sp. N1718]|uniref:Rossmann-like and DUF2520 domain-containing protein n=1 Tax=Flavobacterium sp. N1718 TaxID=2986822 RepID=UPI002224438C|nr:DUF2520 domain-containing protein [Flavobacterium sp. N1718]